MVLWNKIHLRSYLTEQRPNTNATAVGRKLWLSHPHYTSTNLLRCSCCWVPGKTPEGIESNCFHWGLISLKPTSTDTSQKAILDNLLLCNYFLLQHNSQGIESLYHHNIYIFIFVFEYREILYLIQLIYSSALFGSSISTGFNNYIWRKLPMFHWVSSEKEINED